MVEFWFIRHGESEGNAGLAAKSDAQTPLTEKGRQQAAFVPKQITTPPDLFVISPYVRTAQTASPTLDKFPSIPIETWPIHEYTYLSNEMYEGTTSSQRRKPSIDYFLKADPDLNLGHGAESFNQFIGRIGTSFQQISNSNHEFIILFGHGWFMRASLWYLFKNQKTNFEKATFLKQIQDIGMPNSKLFLNLTHKLEARIKKEMVLFFLFSTAVQIPNTGILKFKLDKQSGKIELAGFTIDHLPKELQQTTLSNR